MSASFKIENKGINLKDFIATPTTSNPIKASDNFNLKHSIPTRHALQHKCLPFLIIFSTTLVIFHFLFVNKWLITDFGVMSAGSMIIPFVGILFDIITEVYGFKMAMRLFWSTLISQIIMELQFHYFIFLPSPLINQQIHYEFVLKEISNVKFYLAMISIGYLADRINAYLLIKWKHLLNGRYFWLRSMGSSMVGNIIFSSMALPIWVYWGIATNLHEAINLIVWSFVLKLSIYSLFAYPSTIIVNLLKAIEGANIFEYQVQLNPFIKQKNVGA